MWGGYHGRRPITKPGGDDVRTCQTIGDLAQSDGASRVTPSLSTRSQLSNVGRLAIGLAMLSIVAVAALGPHAGPLTARQDMATPAMGLLATPGSGTPETIALPLTPSAVDCTVAPVPFADLTRIGIPEVAMTPPPSMVTGGAPVDPSRVDAVVATMRVQIGCINAGDIPRALALAGGPYFERLLAQIGSPTEAQYATLATPLPRTETDQITIVTVEQVLGYPDGTLTAQVTTESGPTTVNLLQLEPNPLSPSGYVITQQEQVSRVEPSADPNA